MIMLQNMPIKDLVLPNTLSFIIRVLVKSNNILFFVMLCFYWLVNSNVSITKPEKQVIIPRFQAHKAERYLHAP